MPITVFIGFISFVSNISLNPLKPQANLPSGSTSNGLILYFKCVATSHLILTDKNLIYLKRDSL